MTDYATSDLAYLAGIVDGEGSITLHMRAMGSLRVRLYVGNTSTLLIDWLHEHFAGEVSWNVHKNPDRPARWKQLHHWRIDGDGAIALIAELIPLLVVKRAIAELAIEAWANRVPTERKDRRKPIPISVMETRRDFVERAHSLNQKGIA